MHEYAHAADADADGREASEALGVPPERMSKTLLVSLQGGKHPLAVAIVPVSHQLDLKSVAAAAGAKKAAMADPAEAERATGYVVGGISPLGRLSSKLQDHLRQHWEKRPPDRAFAGRPDPALLGENGRYSTVGNISQ